jgi:acid phosphatase type 7
MLGCASSGPATKAATSGIGVTAGTDSSGHVLLAAGDIAACTGGSVLTAAILDSIPGQVIIPGDAAYWAEGQANPYETCYATTWGRHKSRTRPAPGNHDMQPGMFAMYRAYFGKATGDAPGAYYSFDVGDWHILALNSNIAMNRESEQGRWIVADLAAHQNRCTLAFMHHPRFSSGPHSRNHEVEAVFELLERGGVDVLVSGHDHIYERFAPMLANGARDDVDGVRQFIVGTGGNDLYDIRRISRNSQRRQNRVYGVLKLTLHAESYSWDYVPVASTRFRDTGSARCH